MRRNARPELGVLRSMHYSEAHAGDADASIPSQKGAIVISADKIKLFIDLTIRTHIGVGIALAVVVGISGYVYSSGCGPVIVSDTYGEAADWDLSTAHDVAGSAGAAGTEATAEAAAH